MLTRNTLYRRTDDEVMAAFATADLVFLPRDGKPVQGIHQGWTRDSNGDLLQVVCNPDEKRVIYRRWDWQMNMPITVDEPATVSIPSGTRLADELVKGLAPKAPEPIFWSWESGKRVKWRVAGYVREPAGPRKGQLAAVFIRPDTGARWLYAIDPDTLNFLPLVRLFRRRRRVH